MTMIDANERLMKRINWTAAIYFGDSDKILLGKVNLSKFHIKDSKSAFQQMERDLKNLTELFSINLWIHPPYLHNRITQNIDTNLIIFILLVLILMKRLVMRYVLRCQGN